MLLEIFELNSMQRNGFLSEDTDELLDEVTALVDKMDSSLPLHPLFQPNGFTASQPNAIAAGETLQLNDCASSSHYNNRGWCCFSFQYKL